MPIRDGAQAGCLLYILPDLRNRSQQTCFNFQSQLVEIHFGLWHDWILYLWRPVPGGTITSCWQYKLDWLGADNIVRNDIQFSSWHYCLLNLHMTNCLLSLPSDTWAPTQVTGNAIMRTVDQSLAVPGRSLSPSSPSDRLALGEAKEGRKFIFPPLVPKGISRLPDPQQRSHPRGQENSERLA